MCLTEQSYVGRENYASPARPQSSFEPATALVSDLVNQIAHLSHQPTEQVWQELASQLYCLYGVDLRQFHSDPDLTWLDIAERYDLIDKLYLVSHSYLQHWL